MSIKLNRNIFIRDNLEVLRCMKDKTVDLIYLDPPFNSNRNYGVAIGSKEAEFHFKDMWDLSDTDEAWWGELSDKYPALYQVLHAVGLINGTKDKSYLIYMTMRLIELHRILKDTGSIYLHVDQTMSHSLKLVMDAIFGKKNFISDILWSYNRFSRRGKGFPIMNDTILSYSKTKDFIFNTVYTEPKNNKRFEKGYHLLKENGLKKLLVYDKNKAKDKIKEYESKKYKIVYTTAKKPALGNVWTDISIINSMAKERTGYSTQKPLKLLERIIKASSNEGDIILDPFCGCSTTLVAAEKLHRNWIGIDISEKAVSLIKDRFKNETTTSPKMIKERMDLPIKNAPKPSKNIKHTLYGNQQGNCNGCEVHFPFRNLTIDHIVPKSKGGQDTDKNLQLLCQSCNSIKGDRLDMSGLKASLKKKGFLKAA